MVQKRSSTLVRRKQIIDAARKLIIKYGSEHITVRRIAKEIGTSEGAIYRHFRSKRDVLSLLADHIEDSLAEDVTKASMSALTPLETLDSALRNHISAVDQKRGISFQVIAEIISLGDRKLNKKISDTINRYTGHLKYLLAEGIKAGEVRKDVDLDAAATLLFGMVQGLVNIWALSNHSFDLEQRYISLWNIFRGAVDKH